MFGFGKNKEQLQYKRDVTLAHTAGDAQRPDDPAQEYLDLMGRAGYFTVDENVIKWLFDHPAFHALIAPLAPVNRTTILTKQQAEINRIDLEILITWLKITMPADVYESGAPEVLQGFRIFGNNVINDAVEGKKLEALTIVGKRVEISTEKSKGRFG